MRVSVLLGLEEFQALSTIASTERRIPREQAAMLLSEALRRRATQCRRKPAPQSVPGQAAAEGQTCHAS